MKLNNSKTILVTGGAGFIGSNLIEQLVKDKKNKIISLDNYFTGLKENHIPGAEYREGHTKDIEKHISEKPDLIYHLGEYSRVEKSFDDIKLVWDLNKIGTFAMLEFCRKHNVKIVYAGSSTKFGDGGLGRDQSPYAWTKASNTELVRNYGKWFNLPYAIVYFYNVYGSREISTGSYATVIGIFKELYRQKKPLTVVSPGTQTRNFTHVDDIVSGLILVGNDGEGDDFGIGCNVKYSILDVARMFGSKIVMLPERKGNRMDSDIDTKKIEALGWEPRNDLKTYIKKFISST
ncbi:MAG: NAD-dependent epimerase/dehydratase family protein [Patescibacteria group bacterium]